MFTLLTQRVWRATGAHESSMVVGTARRIFGDNIRRARQAEGLSQEALGERAGIHRTAVGAIERGEANVTIDHMERLAAALAAPLARLLREGDDAGPS